MAKRSETDMKKSALERFLRDLCETPDARQGQALPPQRELAQQFGLSTYSVFSVVQKLIDSGLMHAEPGVGVFSRRSPRAKSIYVYQIHNELDNRTRRIHDGFMQELATRGELSIVMNAQQSLACRRLKQDQPIAGVFSFHAEHPLPKGKIFNVPYVGFYGMGDDSWDTVVFDDHDGGQLATRHLIECGHRNIAFLSGHRLGFENRISWSLARYEGWRKTMRIAGLEPESLLVENRLDHWGDLVEVGRQATERVLAKKGCTAVVAANNEIASGFLQQLRSMEIPLEKWPAIVGFQDSDADEFLNISALYLAYDDLGRAGARLLVSRTSGQETGNPVVRAVPMRLVPRLTSFAGWAKDMAVPAHQMAGATL